MTTIAESDARTATLADMNRALEASAYKRQWTALDMTTGRQRMMQPAINPADVARYILALAAELNDIKGGGDMNEDIAQMVEMISIAGLPANGAGMASEAEWTEDQMAFLDRQYYGQEGQAQFMTRYVLPRRDYQSVATFSDYLAACAERDRLVAAGLPAWHTCRVQHLAGTTLYAVQIGVPRGGPTASFNR